MAIDLLTKIKDFIKTDCSQDYKNIGTYLLKNYTNIKNLTITAISKECNTSPNKITRFAEKLNLKGFNELKFRLNDISNSIIIDNELIPISSRIDDKAKFYNDYFEILLNSIKQQQINLKTQPINEIVSLINKANKIYLFAFNLSYNVSKNFIQRLRWYQKEAISESDYISIKTYLNIIKPDDLVILITISGENEHIKKIAESLNKKVKIIGIGPKQSSMISLFDKYLYFETDESELWSINSIKAQLVIQLLDFVYVKWLKSTKRK
ncbi:MurR/RpiR family transcriptional regulator [Mycoplasma mycoides]|uniref:MurR/RpiR family transcriptional regulator n=1 Tax=Mycoplasma mycoides TaxID=2102 RepID=UPI00223FBE30|nr:MurR/RpiR family transcriptional regulator [Mycoplasma mycoides]QVK09343.1 MurR/RpiR family transcriptional regulator [Mycoplasma mycoides subsp. capri]